MSLRSHLLLLTLLVLVPLTLFGIWATTSVAERERHLLERGARERTLALLTALDTELVGHGERLRGLASSNALRTGDLETFSSEASRYLPTQPDWRHVVVTLPAGARILVTSVPGAAGPPATIDERRLDDALSGSKVTIGDLAFEGGTYLFSVRVPVETSTGKIVLAALIDPAAILALLTPQRLPPDWVGVVLDSKQHIVARTIDNTALIGKPASPSLRAALDLAPEGWFEGTTLEGTPVYSPYHRSTQSSWTVAMGIPTAYIEASLRESVMLLTLGLLGASVIALLFAAIYSRRISSPIIALASAARALGWGAKVSPPVNAPFREVRDVSRALETSAQAISEREARLRMADQAKDEFLAMLGHELRNPLGALSSATQVLNVAADGDAMTREATSIISRQVERMTRLVDDLLDVGRAISGKVSLQLSPMDLGKVVTEVTQHLKKTCVFKSQEIQLNVMPVWIEGDETRIEQIAFNLLENAAKYTGRDGRIAIKVYREGDQAIFEVQDNGIGMSQELLPRVFDLFSQGQRSIDRSISGLGIGLTLVKRLSELHGGTVTAASEGMDRGSTFRLVLPAISPPHQPVYKETKPLLVRHPRKVLLVEDNADARRSMLTILRYYGYRAFEAADGFQGIEMAEEVRPDAAIIDIGLPRCDGYEVAKRLRAGTACTSTLLIALTGYGSEEVRRKAHAAGFDEYLVKPVTPAALAELIESRLGKPAIATTSSNS